MRPATQLSCSGDSAELRCAVCVFRMWPRDQNRHLAPACIAIKSIRLNETTNPRIEMPQWSSTSMTPRPISQCSWNGLSTGKSLYLAGQAGRLRAWSLTRCRDSRGKAAGCPEGFGPPRTLTRRPRGRSRTSKGRTPIHREALTGLECAVAPGWRHVLAEWPAVPVHDPGVLFRRTVRSGRPANSLWAVVE